MISAKDSLVGWTVVPALPPATAGVPANAGWSGATLGGCRLTTFRFFCSGLTTVAGEVAEAYDSSSGDGWSGTASANSVGGGTIVGWVVSMSIRSGGCCTEAIRIIGRLLASGAGAAEYSGRHQFAANSSAKSDVPTQAM